MKKEDEKRVREDKTESQKLEKKLFAITAVLMCVLGAVLGLYAVEFLSVYFPNTNAVQYTLTCTITAIILALVMLSLSKPVCKLLKMFMEKMQTSLSTRPVYKSMSVVFGIIFGISSAILSGAALSVFVPRLPGVMYVFIIAIVFVVFSYIATVVFGKILGANAGSAVDYHRGYVIASSAFQSDKVVRLVPKLIGKIAVMDVTVSILSDKLTDAKMEGEDTTWVFTIRADRFLRNMVRAIVGTLLEVGRGKLTVEGFRKVIEQQDRCKAGTSAPGNALFLVNVEYPEDIFSEETKKSVLSTLLPEGGEC